MFSNWLQKSTSILAGSDCGSLPDEIPRKRIMLAIFDMISCKVTMNESASVGREEPRTAKWESRSQIVVEYHGQSFRYSHRLATSTAESASRFDLTDAR